MTRILTGKDVLFITCRSGTRVSIISINNNVLQGPLNSRVPVLNWVKPGKARD